jgi:hypothetical protein
MLGSRWRPVTLPEGCDLNDLGRQPDGRRQFFALVAQARTAVEKETRELPESRIQ